METDRWRLVKQFFCSHGESGRIGYEEIATQKQLPPGWTYEGRYAESPYVCRRCGYVFADMRGDGPRLVS